MGVPELLEIQDALVEFQVAKSHLEDAKKSLQRVLSLTESASSEEATNLRGNARRAFQLLHTI